MIDKRIQSVLKNIRNDDDKALQLLMDIYIPYVLKIVTSLSGKLLSKEDVEEVISDVFYAIWKNRDTIRTDSDITPFIAQITRNKTKNKLRQASKLSIISETELEILADEVDITNELSSKENIDFIQSAINNFDSPEKEILYGFYFYEFKLAELASRLNLPLSTIKSKLYRSREKLKQKLMEGCRL